MRGTEWDGESLLRLVLAEETPAHYVLAAASLADATVHAVMNYMPFLGRLTRTELAVFENGQAQYLSGLPYALGTALQFTLFSTRWNGSVTAAGADTATVIAHSATNGRLEYTHDRWDGMVSSLTWHEVSTMPPKLRLTLVARGAGYEGPSWFGRARDIFDGTWVGPGDPVNASFMTGSHPRYGAWDALAVWTSAQLESGTASVALTTNAGVSLQRTWGTGVRDASVSATLLHAPLAAGYSVGILRAGEGDVSLRVAGIRLHRYNVAAA